MDPAYTRVQAGLMTPGDALEAVFKQIRLDIEGGKLHPYENKDVLPAP
jgi:hypothetical protein